MSFPSLDAIVAACGLLCAMCVLPLGGWCAIVLDQAAPSPLSFRTTVRAFGGLNLVLGACVIQAVPPAGVGCLAMGALCVMWRRVRVPPVGPEAWTRLVALSSGLAFATAAHVLWLARLLLPSSAPSLADLPLVVPPAVALTLSLVPVHGLLLWWVGLRPDEEEPSAPPPPSTAAPPGSRG